MESSQGRTVEVQGVNPLPHIRTVIAPGVTILERRLPALSQDLLRELAVRLVVGDDGIAAGYGSRPAQFHRAAVPFIRRYNDIGSS